MVYAKCRKKYPDKNEDEFQRIVSKSIRNHFMSLTESQTHPSRSATMVDLEEEIENVGKDYSNTIIIEQSIETMKQDLTTMDIKVLEQLLEPSEGVFELAHIDLLRRRRLRAQGQQVSDADTLKILDRHIAQHLGINKTMMSFHRENIRIAAYRHGLVG